MTMNLSHTSRRRKLDLTSCGAALHGHARAAPLLCQMCADGKSGTAGKRRALEEARPPASQPETDCLFIVNPFRDLFQYKTTRSVTPLDDVVGGGPQQTRLRV
jgi:hypothetical protein